MRRTSIQFNTAQEYLPSNQSQKNQKQHPQFNKKKTHNKLNINNQNIQPKPQTPKLQIFKPINKLEQRPGQNLEQSYLKPTILQSPLLNKIKQNAKQQSNSLQPITIPLNLSPQQSPFVRIHHLQLIKYRQNTQLHREHYVHDFNELGQFQKQMFNIVKMKRVFSVQGNRHQLQPQHKQPKIEKHPFGPKYQKNIKNNRPNSEPHKNSSHSISKNKRTFRDFEEFNFLLVKLRQNKQENKKIQCLTDKAKTFIRKFQLFHPSQGKQRILDLKLRQNIKSDIQKNNMAERMSRVVQKLKSNSFNRAFTPLNKQNLSFQVKQLHQRIKNSPISTSKEQMAIFKNKLANKGQYKLIIQ